LKVVAAGKWRKNRVVAHLKFLLDQVLSNYLMAEGIVVGELLVDAVIPEFINLINFLWL